MTDNRADTDERKDEIINRLEILWKANPELRFMQLLGNVFRKDAYYTEDYAMMEILEKFYSG